MHRSVIAVVVVVALFVSAGCASTRVQLPTPPPADAPLVERERAWESLKPVGSRSGMPMPLGGAMGQWSPRSYLVLAGGARVENARDLVVVVGDGPVKAAADRAAALDEEAAVWDAFGWGLLGVGTVVSVGGLLVLTNLAATAPGQGIPDSAVGGLVAAGAGPLIVLSGLIPTFVASSKKGEATVEKDTAFLLYGEALRRRLDLPEQSHAVALSPVSDPAMVTPEPLR